MDGKTGHNISRIIPATWPIADATLGVRGFPYPIRRKICVTALGGEHLPGHKYNPFFYCSFVKLERIYLLRQFHPHHQSAGWPGKAGFSGECIGYTGRVLQHILVQFVAQFA